MNTSLLFKAENVVRHNPSVISEVVKSSQDLDMQIMNFVINCLLINSADVKDKDLEQTLVQIIDSGCNSVNANKLNLPSNSGNIFGSANLMGGS